MITYFKTLSDTLSPYHRDISDAINRIKSGVSKDLIDQIRSEPDKLKRNEIKKKLPAICFSGEFSKREDSSIIKHSGFICLDFDGFFDEIEMLDYKNELVKDPFSYVVFVSPSGDGLKVIVKIPEDIKNHKNYFLSLEKKYNHPLFDKSCKNISRVCYESYDPDIYVNEQSEIWTDLLVVEEDNSKTIKPTIKIENTSKVIKKLLSWWEKNYGLIPGERNNNTYILAAAFNEYGVPKEDAREVLLEFSSQSFPANEILITLDSAYKDESNHGTKFFEDFDKVDHIKSLVKNGATSEEIIRSNATIPTDIIKSVIETISDEDSDIFWTKDSKGKVRHVSHRFKQYLERLGFYKYYPSGSSNFVFVRIMNNTISDVTEDMIKDFVLEQLYKMQDLSIYNYFADKSSLFKEDYLSLLSKFDPAFMSDSKDTSYIYFNNCAVKVTVNDVTTIDYMDLQAFIWEKQKIDRDYKHSDSECYFKKFITNVSGKDKGRIRTIETTIGFLLHSYKPAGYCPAVIINDEVISDNPEGGTGKGLFMKAISQLKKMVTIDGKMFTFEKSFPYQRVSASTQVLLFDDVKRGFDFEKLFSVITDGITLEKKNKDEIHLPFSESPKIAITTNYAVKGSGNSHDRRKWEIEFSQYYNRHMTPEKEFKHTFFTQWDDDEWMKFDNYMISCLQLYLNYGLKESDFKNLDKRKVIASTNMDFFSWIEDFKIQCNKAYSIKSLYDDFTTSNPDYGKYGKLAISYKIFSRYLNEYGLYRYNAVPEEKKDSATRDKQIVFVLPKQINL